MLITDLVEHKPKPGKRWWTVSFAYPHRAVGWGLWPLPTVEVTYSGMEIQVQVHWLLWGVIVWWQNP